MTISSLEPDIDPQRIWVGVAGPAALLIAKCQKIADRVADSARGRERRLGAKDSGDVIRLMRSTTSPAAVDAQPRILANDPICHDSVAAGLEHLRALFGSVRSAGIDLAVIATAGALDADLVRSVATDYVAAVLHAYRPAHAPIHLGERGDDQGESVNRI